MKNQFIILIFPLLFGMCNTDKVDTTTVSQQDDLGFKLNDELSPDSIPIYDENIPIFVESMPRFSGCEDIEDSDKKKKCSDTKLLDFVYKNMKDTGVTEESAADESTIIIRFIVEEDGSISFHEDIRTVLLRNPENTTGLEIMRIIQSTPKWTPGIQDGKPTRVLITVPFRFHYNFD